MDSEQGKPLTSGSSAWPSVPQLLPNSLQSPATRHRPGFQRVPSTPVMEERSHSDTDPIHGADITDTANSSVADGLGISGAESPSKSRCVDIQPVNAGGRMYTSKEASLQHARKSSDLLMSPPSTGGFSGSTRYEGYRSDADGRESPQKHSAKRSTTSFQSVNPSAPFASSERDLLHKVSATASLRSKYDEWAPEHACVHRHPSVSLGWNWFAIVTITLSVYSTVLSAIFLGVALKGPRYKWIRSNGSFTIGSANIVVSLLAKTIELSFVTVFVAFLGQALARRANGKKKSNGVTLAELSMRSWIMQPGTLITHWESVRYAGVTILGLLSLLAAIVALLYTTASNGLVLPQLKFSDRQHGTKQGLIKTQFANPQYIQDNCETPISIKQDDVYSGSTCVQIEHAAMGYHNYFAYLNQWAEIGQNGNGSTDLASRIPGFALVNDNTTITAPWIERFNSNMTALYLDSGYIVNNVTMAMPHVGILQAAIDPINDIVQPEELDGQGVYSLHGSMPSPTVNVLCVTLNRTQLKPLVYSMWDDHKKSVVDASSWPTGLSYSDPYLGLEGTTLGDIFQWGDKWGSSMWPPVFPRLPIDYNTIVNDTKGLPYGRKAIYILGAGGNVTNTGDPISSPYAPDPPYSLCQLRVGQTPFCSTRYNASSSGGTLEAICEDDGDEMQYLQSLKNATSGNYSTSPDWPNIASEWSRSVSLNDGFADGNASNARLLTQLMVLTGWAPYPQLSAAQPSMAEALAVMAGCTLVQSAKDAPFVQFWNYSTETGSTLDPGRYQYFNASLRAQQYASGGVTGPQKGLCVVLFAVFIINVFVLAYFCFHRSWFPDFSEPQNLFNIAVNSPPSDRISCGGGPHGVEYQLPWKLNTSETGHVYIENYQGEKVSNSLRRKVSTLKDRVSESPLLNWGKFSPRSPR